MKKRILSGIFAFAFLVTVGMGVDKSMKSDAGLSDLALANVEALAQNENGNGNEKTYQVGEKTLSMEIYETTSPGWSWDIGGSIWILNGKTTRNWPPEYRKSITSIKIKCCRVGGDLQDCSYEQC